MIILRVVISFVFGYLKKKKNLKDSQKEIEVSNPENSQLKKEEKFISIKSEREISLESKRYNEGRIILKKDDNNEEKKEIDDDLK